MALHIVNGPNLNLLGSREPAMYGSDRLTDVEQRLTRQADKAGHRLTTRQSNAEHELIDAIHAAPADNVDFLIFNPGALTHTSIALRDAILGVDLPFIEVHISQVHAREAFRHHSYFSDIAVGTITGLGTRGYEFALSAAIDAMKSESN